VNTFIFELVTAHHPAPLSGGHISRDLFIGQTPHGHRHIHHIPMHENRVLPIAAAEGQTKRRVEKMGLPGKLPETQGRLAGIGGFIKGLALKSQHLIGPNHQGAGIQAGHRQPLGFGAGQGQVPGIISHNSLFINIRRRHIKGQSR